MKEQEDEPVDALRIDLQVLAQRGIASHDLRVALPAEWLAGALSGTDAQADRDGRVSLSLSIQPDGTILARGQLEAAFSVPCARCLEPAAVDATTEILVTYVPDGHERAARVTAFDADPEEVDLAEEDLDVYVYRGHLLDLGQMVREQVAVAYPMRALCPRGPACRGLCTGCGADLNALPEGAEACAGCGLPLYQVSQSEADRARGPADRPETPWQAALRKLRDS